jgi:pimeloyl-ACP methyl ester carboxylesterase
VVLEDSRRANVNGAELEYWDIGSGPPVVFIHGGMGDECAAILREPALTTNFRLIHFQRRGFGASSCPEMPVPIPQHAADCRVLLDQLGVSVAHVVGQSYGGAVSLQLTAGSPEIVRSLTVLEPAIPSVLFSSPEFSALGKHAAELYAAGQGRDAIEHFARAVVGSDGWEMFAAGWLERWMRDETILFESDLPAMPGWAFGEADAAGISQPALNLRGVDTPAAFEQVYQTVSQWIPHAESHVVPRTSHPILQMNPNGAAELIVDFINRYPI